MKEASIMVFLCMRLDASLFEIIRDRISAIKLDLPTISYLVDASARAEHAKPEMLSDKLSDLKRRLDDLNKASENEDFRPRVKSIQ